MLGLMILWYCFALSFFLLMMPFLILMCINSYFGPKRVGNEHE